MTNTPAPPPKSRLTKLAIRNFKRFESTEFELGSPVVFVGPNNSGKTTALQALALWQLGVHRWMERRGMTDAPAKRSGVAINRRDVLAVPVREARPLWRDLRVRRAERVNGKQRTTNILIEIEVSGKNGAGEWTCGMEFDYANEESFYCRPLRQPDGARTPSLPKEVAGVDLHYLPPMSGLLLDEVRIEPGAVNVRLGEGRTAEVLRNLCLRLYEERPEEWNRVAGRFAAMFGAKLDPPLHLPARGEIELTYRERGIRFDLTASGRGSQQALLLLTFLSLHPGAVLLLDEPDAHLEILRQKRIYELLTEAAAATEGQIIAATHSEVLLNEAADRDTVIAFVGKPHRIGGGHRDDLLRALGEIEFHDYLLAERHGWVLYLEGSTDLAILRAFARRLCHEAARRALDMPFTRYVRDEPETAQHHFHGLREASPALRGVALFDRLPRKLPSDKVLRLLMWNRYEIENYFCTEKCLLAFAEAQPSRSAPDVFAPQRVETMRRTIERFRTGMEMIGRPPPWSDDTKASTEVVEPILAQYFSALGEYNDMLKKNLHRLVEYLPDDEIPDEVREKLDAIAETHAAAEASR